MGYQQVLRQAQDLLERNRGSRRQLEHKEASLKGAGVLAGAPARGERTSLTQEIVTVLYNLAG